jgi:hypothetical protein
VLVYSLTRKNSALRGGVNLLECSYADSVHNPVRASVLFLVHLSPPIDGATVKKGGKSLIVKQGNSPIDRQRWKQLLVGKGTVDFPSTLILVDDRGRWRGELDHVLKVKPPKPEKSKPGKVKPTPRLGSSKPKPIASTSKSTTNSKGTAIGNTAQKKGKQ